MRPLPRSRVCGRFRHAANAPERKESGMSILTSAINARNRETTPRRGRPPEKPPIRQEPVVDRITDRSPAAKPASTPRESTLVFTPATPVSVSSQPTAPSRPVAKVTRRSKTPKAKPPPKPKKKVVKAKTKPATRKKAVAKPKTKPVARKKPVAKPKPKKPAMSLKAAAKALSLSPRIEKNRARIQQALRVAKSEGIFREVKQLDPGTARELNVLELRYLEGKEIRSYSETAQRLKAKEGASRALSDGQIMNLEKGGLQLLQGFLDIQ